MTAACHQAPLDALRLALDPSTVHPIDVALVNGEVFMNLATAGPVSEVSSKDMNSTLKKVLGPAAVAVAGFQQLFITGLSPIKDVRITYPNSLNVLHDDHSSDQVTTIKGDLLVLAVGQARQMGRMINVCPEALLDDGHSASPKLLKALWAAQQPPGRLSRMIPRLQKMISKTLMYAGMLAVGFALGYNAQNFVTLPGGASEVIGHPVHEESQQLMRV
eukprot:gene6844-7062_t